MKYTDKDLIKASQIAYFTVNQNVLKEAYDETEHINKENPNANIDLNYTLSELYERSDTFRASVYKDIRAFTGIDDYRVFENLTPEEIKAYGKDNVGKQMILFRAEIIEEIKNGKIGSWKVVSYVDNNTIGTPGMAGKLVDGNWVHNNFSDSGAMIIL